MLFNSWEFLILLLATLPLYYLALQRGRKVWQVTLLLAASAVFYAWEEPRLLLLLGASCVVNAVAVERILYWKSRCAADGLHVDGCGLRADGVHVDGCKLQVDDESSTAPPIDSQLATRNSQLCNNPSAKARTWLCATVSLNLAFLAFFKYAGFLAEQLPIGWLHVATVDWLRTIPLPVGISFYTFQGISLVVDVWRNDISPHTAQRLSARGGNRAGSIRDTGFYITFFPQLVAGPIVKAHEFVDQIAAKHFRDIDWITVRRGLVTGYFLKVFVADNLAEQTAFLSAGGAGLANTSALNNVPLLYGYSLQIFADFAGYSLIAIGLGALFGYKLPPNFNFPYLSTSITGFWRRWHLSLSSWLRDYLYFPLGGNRKGSGRTYVNLFLVMFLGGLWHGAAWKFALWGSLHGLALAVERLCSRKRKLKVDGCKLQVDEESSKARPFSTQRATCNKQQTTISNRQPAFKIAVNGVKWLVTFHLISLLWLTFMMPDMASIAGFFKCLVNGRTGFSGPPAFSLLFYGSAVVIYHAWGWLKEHREHLASHLARSPFEPALHGLMLFLILTNPGAPRGFIYFQF